MIGRLLALTSSVLALAVPTGSVARGDTVHAAIASETAALPGGSYRPLAGARLIDTSTGVGAPVGRVRSVTVTAGGRAGVPVSGVSAVVVNLKSSGASAAGWMTAYATGTSRPAVRSLSFAATSPTANIAVVPLDDAGRFSVFASTATNVIADVEGYFTDPAHASGTGHYFALTPRAVIGSDAHSAVFRAGQSATATVFEHGVPTTATAAILSVSVTGGTGPGAIRVARAGTVPPPALNYAARQTTINTVIVPLGSSGRVTMTNLVARANPALSVVGYFGPGGGGYFVPVAPTHFQYYKTLENTYTTTDLAANGTVPSAGSLSRVVGTIWAAAALPPAQRRGAGRVDYLSVQTARRFLPGVYFDGRAASQTTIFGAVPRSGSVELSVTGRTDLATYEFGYFRAAVPAATPAGIWASFRRSDGSPELPISTASPAGPYRSLSAGAAASVQVLTAAGLVVDVSSPIPGSDELSDSSPVIGVSGAVQLAASAYTDFARDKAGRVYAWGSFDNGQRGIAARPGDELVANRVPTLSNVTFVGAVPNTAYAVTSTGQLWAWGGGRNGQLGNGSTSDSATPVKVVGPRGVTAIGGNVAFTEVVDANGDLWRWGRDASTGTVHTVPVKVDAPCRVTAIAIKSMTELFHLCSDGTVAGEPGLDQIAAITPVGPVQDLAALRSDGTVWRILDADVTGWTTHVWQQVPGLNHIRYVAGDMHQFYASTGS